MLEVSYSGLEERAANARQASWVSTRPLSGASLRWRIQLLVLVFVTPMLGLTLYTAFEQRQGAAPVIQADAGRVPQAAVVAAAQRLWVRTLALLGLVSLGVVGMTGLFAEHLIVRRLRGLVETTKRWAAGDFSVRSRLARDDGELGQLGLALNDMAESLQRHLLERKYAERRERQRGLEADQAYHALQQTHSQLIQSEKLAAIGQLASGVAHDVRNPLAIISQGIHFLQRAAQGTSEESMDTLARMQDAGDRANRIIQALLTLARPASLQLERGNLHEVIAASLVLFEQPLLRKRIVVVKELMEHPPFIWLDANQTQQVFINLITNAMQAMPEQGTLTIRTTTKALVAVDPQVDRCAGDCFHLGEQVLSCEVQDTGIGIPREQLEKVFEPFFTTKPPGEGTGLGLSIVRSIVERHHGCITVESAVGQGTTVRILFPLAPEQGVHTTSQVY